jgi:hypothetical protein
MKVLKDVKRKAEPQADDGEVAKKRLEMQKLLDEQERRRQEQKNDDPTPM